MTKLDLPVYESKSYNYVRIADVQDQYIRLDFTQFMRNKVQPLLYKDGKVVTDAVFMSDYDDFLVYLDEKYSKGD